MGLLANVLIGLLTTLIGYALGRLWQRLADQVPRREARKLWGPVFAGNFQVVVSRFWPSGWSDPAGVVGGGDALALRELGVYFSKIGSEFDVVYVDEPSLDREGNLILLGGPDTNSVTKEALARMAMAGPGSAKPSVRIVDPGPGSPMEVHDLAPDTPQGEAIKGRRSRMRKYRAEPDIIDYGVLIRARNPFSSSPKALIIIAGAYGYGTWGGASMATKDWFLGKCQQLDPGEDQRTLKHLLSHFQRALGGVLISPARSAKDTPWVQFECIFKVNIYDQRPHAPEVIGLRPLGEE
jgi:hypothetical protein